MYVENTSNMKHILLLGCNTIPIKLYGLPLGVATLFLHNIECYLWGLQTDSIIERATPGDATLFLHS